MLDDIFSTRNISLSLTFDQGEFMHHMVRGKPGSITLDYTASMFLNLHYTRNPKCLPRENLVLVNDTSSRFGQTWKLVDSPTLRFNSSQPSVLHFNGKAKEKFIQEIWRSMPYANPEFNTKAIHAQLYSSPIFLTDDSINVTQVSTLGHVCAGYFERLMVEAT